ncbi:MAG: DNA alkylation repair protein [Candidatus Omnitrophica bacterium]|nr:DNA alkylation repair protein [Candidatus Omnitrophota bacterium]
MSSVADEVRGELRLHASEEKATLLGRFFKTGPGDYGEGDVFIGVKVPETRRIAKRYFKAIRQGGVRALLASRIHEERLAALIMMVLQFEKGSPEGKEDIYRLYLASTRRINNWDLVDISAGQIVGGYLFDRDREILYRLASSDNLWERRIAVIATFYFIRKGQYGDTLGISEKLLGDREDLIHKATGWMLRETGKRDKGTLVKFIKKNYKQMPRTMLRYAIELFPEKERQMYLRGRFGPKGS